jgi:integrase
MATLKYVIRTDKPLSDGRFTIYTEITHRGQSRYKKTNYRVHKDQFRNGAVVNHGSAAMMNIELRTLLNSDELKILKLGSRVEDMTATEVVHYLKKSDAEGKVSFFQVLDDEIKSDHGSLARTMRDTKAWLEGYAPNLTFNDITVVWLKRMESDMLVKNNSPTTVNFHMRNIRNIFNRGIDNHNVDANLYPFRKYKLPKPTVKPVDNIPVDQLRKYINAKLSSKGQNKARDRFMLSFYLIGANLKDILTAKRTQLKNGRFEYVRAKTKKLYSVKVEPEALVILDRYHGKKLLLNFVENLPSDSKRTTPGYKGIVDNKRNKLISKNLEIMEFSTYSARYTWATIAHEIGVPRDVISAALGHDDGAKVTALYINFDQAKIDQANRRVIDYVNQF